MNNIEEFTVKNGIICNPGKFEGEKLSTPYFYDIYLNGGDWIIEIKPEDKQLFKDIPENFKYAIVLEDDQGFITVEFSNNPEEYEYSEENYDDYEDEM